MKKKKTQAELEATRTIAAWREQRHRRDMQVLIVSLMLISGFVVLSLGIFYLISPAYFKMEDAGTLVPPALIILGVFAVLLFVNRHLSSLVACILFDIVVTAAIVMGDTPVNIFHGRSFVYFIIPVVATSLIIRPWAGYIVTGLIALATTLVTRAIGIPLPDIPGLLALFFVTFIVFQVVTRLENNLEKELVDRRQLEASENRFSKIFNLTPIPRFLLSSDNIILECNQAFVSVFGFGDMEEIKNQPLMDVIRMSDPAEYKRLQEEFLKTGTVTNFELDCENKYGRRFIASLSGTVVFDWEGKVSYTFCILQDVTQRAKMEADLRQSEEKYRLLVQNLPIGVSLQQGDMIRFINPTGARILGAKSPDEIIDTSSRNFLTTEAWNKLPQSVSSQQDHPLNLRAQLVRLDGTVIEGEMVVLELETERGVSTLSMFSDVTERLRAEQEIEKQNRHIQDVSRRLVEVQESERRNLAAELHDEVGQDLTSMKLALDLVESSRIAAKREKAIQNARVLVGQLMNKVRSLSLDLRPPMLDDFGLISALGWLFERVQKQAGMTVTCECDLDKSQRFTPGVESAAFRIIQEALTNIARHAHMDNAQVRLWADEFLHIEVSDEGSGFDLQDVARQSIHTAGLSGMQERARVLGGEVSILSAPGSGTRVVARLPLSAGGK